MSKLKRNDLQGIAQARLREAKLLLDGGAFAGAYYLTGLAVECALKACIARATEEFEFPDRDRVKESWSHDLAKLLTTAGLTGQLASRIVSDKRFDASWRTIRDWKVDSRYEQKLEPEARSIYQAAADPAYGILAWIEGYW